MNGLPSRYTLPLPVHNDLQQEILDIFLGNILPSKEPTAVIIGGQPGCGKTGIIEIYQTQRFTDSTVCIINGDELRRFHPDSDEIFKLHEKRYAELTDPDVRMWTSALFQAAIKKKVNLIFEGTMRTPQICQTIELLNASGYTVIVCPLAVSYALSIYSICKRFAFQKTRSGKGRYVNFASHDSAYGGMPLTLTRIIFESLYHELSLYGRSFSGSGYMLLQEQPSLAVSALRQFRSRKMHPSDKKLFMEAVMKLDTDLRQLGEEKLNAEMLQRIRQGLSGLKDIELTE